MVEVLPSYDRRAAFICLSTRDGELCHGQMLANTVGVIICWCRNDMAVHDEILQTGRCVLVLLLI
jgi:hypothetical protein